MKRAIAKYFYIGLLSLVTNFFVQALGAQNVTGIRGLVEDVQGKPLQFATAKLSVDGTELASKTTDAKGVFQFSPEFLMLDSITLEISYVNKATQTIVVKKAEYLSVVKVVLSNLSLTLNDVVVTGVVKNQNSASSIVFDEEAIRQLQAFSLMDVLNTLPGRKTEAPNLQSPQTINLRTSASGVDAMNNSFGVAIFIDGIRISNETNMQSRGISSNGLGGSLLSGKGGVADVAFNGFDLRDIPMSNIANIEIIQGIGSARYGDFTNGAILITTKAGKTPVNFNMNINGGSSSFSLSKGLDLGKKAGALNFSLGYLNSNNDPRDKVKSYDNINASIRWTKEFLKNITNSLSLNFDNNLDDYKADPDDDEERMSYSKRQNLRLSNTTQFNFKRNRFWDNAFLSLSYSTGIQDSYTQWLFNGMPKGIAGKDTTGVYEGYFVPGNYLAVEQIDGKPISYSVNADIQSKLLKTFGVTHQLSAGMAYSASGNKGLGNIVDPDKPRWLNQADQNERAFSYEDSVQFTTNMGLYLQDNMKGKFFDKVYNLSLGIRLNLQNGRGNLQPRLSFNYRLHKNWSLSSSYGITFKSPSLAHLYPAPTYFDIALLNLYTGYAKNSLYLVYTEKVLPETRNLKQAMTWQFEQGVNFTSNKIGSGSIFGYFKKSKDGFNTFNEFVPTDVPIYDYALNADSTIRYFPTGGVGTVWDLKRYRMNNGLQSTDYGLQFSFQTKPLKVIATSLGIRGGYTVSEYRGANLTTIDLASVYAQQEKGIVYVEYLTRERVSRQALINFTSNTHIPRIGFVVSMVADYQPLLQQRWEANNIYPLSFIKTNGEHTVFTESESKSDEWAFLRKAQAAESLIIPSRGFWTFNMRVAKEIKKNIRLSVSAFNVLNVKPKAYKTSENTVSIYGYKPVSITIGASLQL